MKPIEKGFTLIEIMVAMAVLAIALTVIFELFSGGLRLAGKSENYSRAIFYGRQLLEEICLQKNLSENEEEGEFAGGYTWRYEIKPLSVLIEQNGDNNFSLKIFDVKVSVFWPSGENKKTINFETFKTVVEKEESL